MKQILQIPVLGLGLLLTSCQSNSNDQASVPQELHEKPVLKANKTPNLSEVMNSHINTNGPKLIKESGAIKFWDHQDRIYVTGSEKMAISFYKHGHLPYTKTILGAGPNGETVVYEVDKNDAAYANNLIHHFEKTPFLMDTYKNMNIYALAGRLYITGQDKTAQSFEKHGHLPYTKTILGEGPNGETLVFEVDKSDEIFSKHLIELYHDMPRQILNKTGFIVFKKSQRLYVVSSTESSKKFKSHGHLPYTKTILGAGPNGETVIFEVVKENDRALENMMSIYAQTPWKVKDNHDFHVYKLGERFYVTGDATASKFEKHGHLPYTKTILGAGPNGETVVFEVNKDQPNLTENLITTYNKH